MPNESGMISVNGKLSPSYPYTWNYASFGGNYKNVKLEAIPVKGYAFVEWTGSNKGRKNPIFINVPGDIVMFAHFVKE